MKKSDPNLEVRFARTEAEIRAAQRLRYRVFVEELGAKCLHADHDARLEIDEFDGDVQHLCLFDKALASQDVIRSVIGVYRLIDQKTADKLGGFYSQREYDLSKVLALHGRKLELGRSCIDQRYRGGAAMAMLWSALGDYVQKNDVRYLFGTASFQGADVNGKEEALANLYHNFLMPEEKRAFVLEEFGASMNLRESDDISKLRAMKETPSLIKAYLRLGGTIGDGAFIDKDFNTVDVFVFMNTAEMVEKYKAMYL